jgi:hypothetical protein
MNLRQCIDNLKFDARMVDINMKAQTLSQAELKRHLESLPDLQGQTISMDLENPDLDSSSDDVFSKQDIN